MLQRLLFVFLFLVCGRALAGPPDQIFNPGNGDLLRFTSDECVVPVAADAVLEFGTAVAKSPQAVYAFIDGKHMKACWIDLGPNVGLWYEDGEIGVVPKRFLKPAA